jgi:imidazole glycerol phosphate synthase subunit HisF
MGRYVVLGRSVHSVDVAHQASHDGAEFVIAGTVYKSPSKPEVKPAGLSLISDITKDVSQPVLAIGGVTAEKVEELIKAGAAGVAVVSAITKAEDPKAAAEALTGTRSSTPRNAGGRQRVIQEASVYGQRKPHDLPAGSTIASMLEAMETTAEWSPWHITATSSPR